MAKEEELRDDEILAFGARLAQGQPTADEILAFAARLTQGSPIEWHGFVGGEIDTGWYVRMLIKNGRTYYDQVTFQTSAKENRHLPEPDPKKYVVLSRSSFPIESEWGPVVVVDRWVPAEFRDPNGWIETVTKGVQPSDEEEPARRVPMGDDRFWGFIEVMGGAVSDAGVEALRGALEGLTDPELLAFQDALEIKLGELAHAGNTASLGSGEDEIVSSDASLYYRCEIVARGRDAFEDYLRNPRKASGGDGAEGEALLTVAEGLWMYPVRPAPLVDVETGAAARARVERPGGGHRSARRVAGPLFPSPSPFSASVQRWRLDKGTGQWDGRSFYKFAAYTVKGSRVRELMGCVMAATAADARTEVTALLESRLGPGEHLYPAVVIGRTGIDGVYRGSGIAGFKRKSRLSIDDYIAYYYNGDESITPR